MSHRKRRERLRHLWMAGGEKPRDDRAPIVTSDMRRLTPKGFDEGGNVIDQVVDRVALLRFGSIGEAIGAKVGGARKAPGVRKRVHLARPGLCPFWKSVQEDEHVGLRRAVDHRPEPKTVRLHHVLTRGHLICLMNSVAASRASSSTPSRPWPWPLKTTSRALGMSLIFSCNRSRRANGSRSPLMKSVGHWIRGKCSVRSWSGKPGRCSG